MAQGEMDLARRPVPKLLCLPERGRTGPGSLLTPFQECSSNFQAAQQLPVLTVIFQLGQVLQAIPQVPWSRALPREM